MEETARWLYSRTIGLVTLAFSMFSHMGDLLFGMGLVDGVVQFFSQMAWCLFAAGLGVSAFEFAIDRQYGRANLKDTAMNAIKGFFAVSLFTTVPVRLYRVAVDLQTGLSLGLTDKGDLGSFLESMDMEQMDGLASKLPGFGGTMVDPIVGLVICIMIAYATFKVFFGNLKRGGILLIQICVGSLYMFSVPRGYLDGFTQWCKQIIGLCFTTFMQAVMLTAGLLALPDNLILGIGVMLAAGEAPRIAGLFGLDTSTRPNIMGAVHTAQTAVGMTRALVQVVSK